MAKTGIAWTDYVWNPVVGCTHAGSPGCDNCYARALHRQRHIARIVGHNMPVQYAKPFDVVQCLPERIGQPWHWKTPRRIFVNSMSDLFHDDVPYHFIHDVRQMIKKCNQHTFMILTKRAENMSMFSKLNTNTIPNLWCGVSVENQAAADNRIPLLMTTTMGYVRFLSIEPMLGPVTLSEDFLELGNRGWVIAGCESGSNRRQAQTDWFLSLRDQCVDAGIPYFLKQMEVNGKIVKEPELDGQKWLQFPGGQR